MTDQRRPPSPQQSSPAPGGKQRPAAPSGGGARKAKPKATPASSRKPAAPRTSGPAAKPRTGKPAMPRRAPKKTKATASPATDSVPVSTTRIVARPPSAPRPSEGGKEGSDAKTPGAWSRVAIVTSSQIRKGPVDKGETETLSPLAATINHSKTALGNVTTRMQERLRERSKAKNRVLLITWAKRAAYVGAAVLAVWLLLLSPVFALDPTKVEASGFGTVVDPAAVNDAIATHEGTSLALLNTTHLANEIRDVPGVRAVHIEREWPAGLAVTIESREPVAAVPDPEGGYLLIDDEAVQVGRSDEAPDNLPAIEVPVGEDHVRVLKSVLGVVDQLPVEVSRRVDNIKAATEDSVTFTLRKGPRVEWGSSEQSALKARVLEVLLNSGDADDAKVIDVSAPTLPITSK
ncbi:cell division protein FtsQ/DivIB [Demequina aurantiaca]|uniref:cell division protein FtsQ/DivIB n=1 Tax=Demequina aurantiaca TaxID=676200 RepID=UPI000B16349E|nr:FtsQ-type POTRA domain-containing protein [Demequina aurantiaca]